MDMHIMWLFTSNVFVCAIIVHHLLETFTRGVLLKAFNVKNTVLWIKTILSQLYLSNES